LGLTKKLANDAYTTLKPVPDAVRTDQANDERLTMNKPETCIGSNVVKIF